MFCFCNNAPRFYPSEEDRDAFVMEIGTSVLLVFFLPFKYFPFCFLGNERKRKRMLTNFENICNAKETLHLCIVMAN
jgi:hypothetical protein